MFFGLKKRVTYTNITVNNYFIERIPYTKFLGVYLINEDLPWSSHIDNIYKSLSNDLSLLKTAKYYFPKCILRLLFIAYFMSCLNYDLCIWGNIYASYLQPLKELHNFCIEILSNTDCYAHFFPLAGQLIYIIIKFDDFYFFKSLYLYLRDFKLYSFNLF